MPCRPAAAPHAPGKIVLALCMCLHYVQQNALCASHVLMHAFRQSVKQGGGLALHVVQVLPAKACNAGFALRTIHACCSIHVPGFMDLVFVHLMPCSMKDPHHGDNVSNAVQQQACLQDPKCSTAKASMEEHALTKKLLVITADYTTAPRLLSPSLPLTPLAVPGHY